MNQEYKPLGWPGELELTAAVRGVDTAWVFTIRTKHPPRQIREMYGDWQTLSRAPGPLANPVKPIPQRVIDNTSVKVLEDVVPDREWVCELRAMFVAVGDLRRIAIYTTKYVANNDIWHATFQVGESVEQDTLNGLRQALIQFANGIGVGP